jgi:hypothetical protein
LFLFSLKPLENNIGMVVDLNELGKVGTAPSKLPNLDGWLA